MPMTKEEAAALLQQVRENRKKLDSCELHIFEGDPTSAWSQMKDGDKLYKRYRCTRCGGTVGTHDWYWYMNGFKHGRNAK